MISLVFNNKDAIDFGNDADAYEIWWNFANARFNPGSSNSASITHSMIRHVHRLLDSIMFARTSQRNILIDEFFILHAVFTTHSQEVNFASLLAARLV